MIRLGILGSTRGTNMLTLIEAINKGALSATIEVVISNKSNALILERARNNGLKAEFLNTGDLSRSDYDKQINERLLHYHVDLVVLIGYMRILSPDFVALWNNKVINVHPSLLPAFAGKMDAGVHQAVLDSGIKETGCTIHYVTQQVDAGPIILQKKCEVLVNDTVDSLKHRVQELEGPALVEAIQLIAHRLEM
ncbi:phosphoribosylglycinamide formyltransferase [Legionella maioricensis]|uniref:Phosphoribosylglycinamide formyltransferase n=1 Tax=Legionella maioricensis TaxID=2896528 RepID=A0A9X2IA53_9GAMM|nr:phosphoribosylglycinamide formyltransferase [Legionella maioricensis]MCL9683749.1 phosphoribosylglycinamide formyltransferase [Legionella maioricensis]MCL9687523.1 phosphoribosylglycinamide formyltransferase [Legionella maioricensis]